MNRNKLAIPEIDQTPPALELTSDEIDALADELVDYHAEFSDLFYCIEQAHWAYKCLQGLLLPLKR